MVFLNYSTMQMVAKVVYYGPGLCGKTTNLKEIYKKTSPRSRGEMVSLETETDRTLFFDLLPMDVGVVGGFKTKFQLYTVPGQVFYNSTRKLVLRGVDGIVFVADSQKPMEEANRNSYENLMENLTELGLEVEEVPLVFQYNKRDLPNVLSVDAMNETLNQLGRPFVEAAALEGRGVFETLKEISKQTLVKLRVKALDQERRTVQAREKPPEPVELVEEPVEELPAETIAMEVEDLPDVDEMPDVVSFDDTDKEIVMEEEEPEGLPSFSGDGVEEVMATGSDGAPIEGVEDNLDDFDLDFSEEDELSEDDLVDEDSLSFQEFTELEEEIDPLKTQSSEEEDLMEDTLQSFDEDELDDAVDLAVDNAFSLDGSTELDLDDTPSNDETPTVSMEIPDLSDEAPTVHMEIPDLSDEAPTVHMEAPLILEENEPFQDVTPQGEIPATLEPPLVEPPQAEVETATPQRTTSQSAPEKSKASKSKLGNSLKELETFATQAIKSKALKTRKANVNVDSLLTDLVGGGKSQKARAEKFKVTIPGNIDAAQFNCVFLDKDENVVHTQLLKVTPRPLGDGRYKIAVNLEIEVEE